MRTSSCVLFFGFFCAAVSVNSVEKCSNVAYFVLCGMITVEIKYLVCKGIYAVYLFV